jgi:hypothetical protein
MQSPIMHEVKAPFTCREGQFADGGRNLCFGILLSVLQKAKNPYRVKVGRKIYTLDPIRALVVAEEKRAYYKTKAGKVVAIVPLFICEEEEDGKVL